MSRTNPAFHDHKDRRAADRIPLGLPATVSLGTRSYTVKLLNITRHGAMLEMGLPLRVRSSVAVNCGSVSADAEVMWNKGEIVGVSFKSPIAEAQVREQIDRHAALQTLRGQKRQL